LFESIHLSVIFLFQRSIDICKNITNIMEYEKVLAKRSEELAAAFKMGQRWIGLHILCSCVGGGPEVDDPTRRPWMPTKTSIANSNFSHICTEWMNGMVIERKIALFRNDICCGRWQPNHNYSRKCKNLFLFASNILYTYTLIVEKKSQFVRSIDNIQYRCCMNWITITEYCSRREKTR
jgi:hypothetical protein